VEFPNILASSESKTKMAFFSMLSHCNQDSMCTTENIYSSKGSAMWVAPKLYSPEVLKSVEVQVEDSIMGIQLEAVNSNPKTQFRQRRISAREGQTLSLWTPMLLLRRSELLSKQN
jgi:hypothetical protein